MRRRRFAARVSVLLWLLLLAAPAFAAAQEAIGVTCKEALPEDSPAKRLARCNGGFGDAKRLARIYEQKLGLPAEVARGLAEAVRSDAAIEEFEHAIDFSPEPVQKVESQFIELLDRAPENPAVLDEIQQFYLRWEDQLDSPAAHLLDRVEKAPDPIGLALRLVGPDTRTEHPLLTNFLLAALAVRPNQPVLWERAARLVRNAGWKAAFFEQAYRVYWIPRAAAPRPEDVSVALLLAAEWLQSELDNGLAEEATRTFHSLPAILREPLAAGRTLQVKTEVEGLLLDSTVENLQLRLAAGCLLAGDATTANDLLASATRFPSRQKALARLLERFLHPLPADAYALLAAVRLPQGGALDLAIARFAEREGYPVWSSHALQLLLAQQLSWHLNLWQPARGVPDSVAAQAHRLAKDFLGLYQALGVEMRVQTDAARLAPKGPRIGG